METRLLSADEFDATFGERMIDITGREDSVSPDGVIDVSLYVDAVPTCDLAGHTVTRRTAAHVYRCSDDRFDHVLFATEAENVFLVVVVDLREDSVTGHHVLDLNEKYGITERPH